MERLVISSGTTWEAIVGYSRAVRVGAHVYVSGTTAIDETGVVFGKDDAYTQTIYILQTVETALQRCGAKLQDVVRTRIYVTDIDLWEQVGRAHGDVFGSICPASTMVEVSRLIAPDLLVEIEVEALVLG